MPDHNYFANLIWQIADLLRGPYRPPQYERVMLPMTVLRRFDCVLAESKPKVLAEYAKRKGGKLNDDALDRLLNKAAGQRFHNHSALNFEELKGDPDNIEKHLVDYIKRFSGNVRTIFDFFELENEIEKMREANILYLVVSNFCDVDLHPDTVPNEQMGLIFENLIRRFNELANETAGDHFTPREVIRLMVNILFIQDDKLLATPGTVRKLLDPPCGTGGMLAEAQNYLREHHSAARLFVYGQDYNKRAFATAASDMLMKQVDHNGGVDNVRFGDSFTDDQFAGETFDYFLTNPPFGVDWKKQQKEIQQEHEKLGFDGRFGAGLPRVNDGALLFLQHMISKFEPVRPAEHKHGSRLAIVFSGSPLFTGGAGSGESDIRKWIIENDWLEGIVALPEQMFYNTGIGTYVWFVTNRKEKRRKGKIQLLDAREFYVPMRRSLGDKRRKIGEKEDGRDQITEIVQLYGRFADGETSKTFDNFDFGYTRVTVERPLRLRYQMTTEDKARFLDACPHLLDDVQAIDKALGREAHRDWNAVWRRIEHLLRERKSRWKAPEQKLFRSVFTQKDSEAEPVQKGGRDESYEPDADLRDFENVPLKDDIDAYFEREVRPHVPDAWMDRLHGALRGAGGEAGGGRAGRRSSYLSRPAPRRMRHGRRPWKWVSRRLDIEPEPSPYELTRGRGHHEPTARWALSYPHPHREPLLYGSTPLFCLSAVASATALWPSRDRQLPQAKAMALEDHDGTPLQGGFDRGEAGHDQGGLFFSPFRRGAPEEDHGRRRRFAQGQKRAEVGVCGYNDA